MSKDKLTTKLAATEASLKRWQSRLKRAVNKVNELDARRRRLQLQLLNPDKPVITMKVKVPVPVETDHLSEAQFKDFVTRGQAAQAAVDDLTIPKELDRRIPAIAEEMTKARRKAEAEARSAMPLSGRAAQAKIREAKSKK